MSENSLAAIRDLLYPAFRMSGPERGWTGDLYIDYVRGRIIVEMHLLPFFREDDVYGTVVVRRIIPPKDIADRSYIAKFNPLLLDMAEECKREQLRVTGHEHKAQC